MHQTTIRNSNSSRQSSVSRRVKEITHRHNGHSVGWNIHLVPEVTQIAPLLWTALIILLWVFTSSELTILYCTECC